MAPIWPTEVGQNSTIAAATTVSVARSRSGLNVRAMPHTA
jgi:hypothetical protein